MRTAVKHGIRIVNFHSSIYRTTDFYRHAVYRINKKENRDLGGFYEFRKIRSKDIIKQPQ